ncbi:hypothetical protein MDA_GLEAN10014971 [Myotis davidii]|uniref:Uncharacterized protein n=1 Tax=Myotis davidii TaxID=225400 RepID=L5LQM6_MYODS|nr:hypothetical protein MDA_GLEAN10014971 [Myotis davidii]
MFNSESRQFRGPGSKAFLCRHAPTELPTPDSSLPRPGCRRLEQREQLLGYLPSGHVREPSPPTPPGAGRGLRPLVATTLAPTPGSPRGPSSNSTTPQGSRPTLRVLQGHLHLLDQGVVEKKECLMSWKVISNLQCLKTLGLA